MGLKMTTTSLKNDNNEFKNYNYEFTKWQQWIVKIWQ
jgi:hypothetical protein